MKNILLNTVKILPVLALLSCSSTHTQVKSTNEVSSPPQIKRVFVVGIAKDDAIRKEFENDFASELGKYKVTAIPSYTVFPGDKIPDKDALKAELAKDNIDSVLITRLVSNKDVQQYVPGSVSPSYGNYWGFYGYGWGAAYTPGYTVTNQEVVLETNLYNTASENLIWSATSNTTSQAGNSAILNSFITAMVDKMQKDKLIK